MRLRVEHFDLLLQFSEDARRFFIQRTKVIWIVIFSHLKVPT